MSVKNQVDTPLNFANPSLAMSPIKKIQKRSGVVADFDQAKITKAIWKAAKSVGGTDKSIAEQISNQVSAVLEVFFKDDENFPTVEQIQDLVEKILIEGGHAKTAKAYIIYREQHKNIRNYQEELLNGRTTALPFSMNALKVLSGKYLQRDEEGEVAETPEEMFDRVATALANVEKDYEKSEAEIEEIKEEFFKTMANLEFLPAGRTLANAGGKTRLVANCIVLHPEDSMDGIFSTLRDAALLQQAGSGLGFPWHILRPAGYRTTRTQGMASGPVSFMAAYNQSFGVIKQQGRHGANMGVMRIDHPDILEFIESKWEEGSLVNFNISVSLTDEFMEAVKSKSSEPWVCKWNDIKMKPRRVIRDNRGSFVEAIDETITASELMDKIINSAWRNGEPGVLFPDTANRANPIPKLGTLEATNPCGEQWLHDGDVCNLGSINLAKFITNREVDTKKLEKTVETAIRMLDNVIDISDFPVEKVNSTFRNNRRVGLGIMGFADMLYQLRIPYNSAEGVAVAEKVMKLISETGRNFSEKLAKEKDCFPNWELSIYGSEMKNRKQRNSALNTVAPTGSLSMVADCGSGIEPFFALAYNKVVMGGQSLIYINPYLEAELDKLGLNTEKIKDEIERSGTLQHIEEIPEETKRVFVAAMEISAEDHIAMQAAFQKYVDNSISKTINFPNEATREDVRKGYVLAWESGLKGCTVYRDGSRQEQVLVLNKDNKDETQDPKLENIKENFEEVLPPPVTERVQAKLDMADRMKGQLNKKEIIASKKCPECGGGIQVGEGCMLCLSCGFSVCSV
jgi:ribonucleoside-diphosphate reductase alpha chain